MNWNSCTYILSVKGAMCENDECRPVSKLNQIFFFTMREYHDFIHCWKNPWNVFLSGEERMKYK